MILFASVGAQSSIIEELVLILDINTPSDPLPHRCLVECVDAWYLWAA